MADPNHRYSEELGWRPGVSLSQARFALSNFCLTHFGTDGQYFADVIEFCADVGQLQEVLNTIRDEVRGRYPDRLRALVTCVREANEDGAASVAVASQPVRNAATDPLHLEASVSLAQARFALSEFCLNQFGPRAQHLLDAIERCREAAALQKVLSVIGSELRGRHDSLSKLIDCVREINATGD